MFVFFDKMNFAAFWYTKLFKLIHEFLLRDAMQSAVLPRQVICLSVYLSVALRYHDHTGWNASKIISRLVSLECTLSAYQACSVASKIHQ